MDTSSATNSTAMSAAPGRVRLGIVFTYFANRKAFMELQYIASCFMILAQVYLGVGFTLWASPKSGSAYKWLEQNLKDAGLAGMIKDRGPPRLCEVV